MFPHDILYLLLPVFAFAAWTEHSIRSFSKLAKHRFQKIIGLVDPFIGDLTPT
jgi:hypothetical protein